MRRFTCILALCLPLKAWAAYTGDLSADYSGYSHGFTVMKLTGSISLTPSGYTLHVTFHTAGLVGMVLHTDNESTASGTFDGGAIRPARFSSSGHLRGNVRETVIDYVQGDPVTRLLSPPASQERTPVDAAQTRGTIDTLSAVALLMRQVAQSGKCGGDVRTFDGRRLAEQHVAASGREVLPRSDHSIFSGAAMRCDFEGRQLAGFMRDEDEASLRKPRRGSAWLAEALPGALPIPVRITFENKLLGAVTLYLTAVRANTPPAVAQCCGSDVSRTP